MGYKKQASPKTTSPNTPGIHGVEVVVPDVSSVVIDVDSPGSAPDVVPSIIPAVDVVPSIGLAVDAVPSIIPVADEDTDTVVSPSPAAVKRLVAVPPMDELESVPLSLELVPSTGTTGSVQLADPAAIAKAKNL